MSPDVGRAPHRIGSRGAKKACPGASPCHGASGAMAVPLHQVERDAEASVQEAKQGEAGKWVMSPPGLGAGGPTERGQ